MNINVLAALFSSMLGINVTWHELSPHTYGLHLEGCATASVLDGNPSRSSVSFYLPGCSLAQDLLKNAPVNLQVTALHIPQGTIVEVTLPPDTTAVGRATTHGETGVMLKVVLQPQASFLGTQSSPAASGEANTIPSGDGGSDAKEGNKRADRGRMQAASLTSTNLYSSSRLLVGVLIIGFVATIAILAAFLGTAKARFLRTQSTLRDGLVQRREALNKHLELVLIAVHGEQMLLSVSTTKAELLAHFEQAKIEGADARHVPSTPEYGRMSNAEQTYRSVAADLDEDPPLESDDIKGLMMLRKGRLKHDSRSQTKAS